MVYATVARGYEPGGFNLTNFEGESELLGFGPEEATSFEAGWKGRLAEGTVTATVAAFYIDYNSRQVEYQATGADGGVIEGIINLGDSTQSGIEGEISIRVGSALTLYAAAGVVNAEWDSGVEAAGVDLSGSRPPVVPDFSWNAGLDYGAPGRGWSRTDRGRYRSATMASTKGCRPGIRSPTPRSPSSMPRSASRGRTGR